MKRCAIIGGGISGLATAYYLQKKSTGIRIDLYEAQNRLGGVLRTDRVEDCIIDTGPDSFLTQKKHAITLCRELGMESSLLGSNDAHRKTFLFHQGMLKPLPDGFFLMVPTKFLPLLTTDLLSWPGKLDALADLFADPEEKDCTVAEFIEKRFGKEIVQQIAEPLITGIYGSDVTHLSLRSALPQIWELQKRGSLIRTLLRRAPESARESLFTTLKDGMESLAGTLRLKCPNVKWILSTPIELIHRTAKTWTILDHEYDFVVVAAFKTPKFSTSSGERIRFLLDSVHHNSAVVVAVCFDHLNREGFGWLVPQSERHSVLACTYLNNKFAGRLPENKFLVRLFIGGEAAAHWIRQSDESICEEALREMKRIAGIDQTPRFWRVYRWPGAMPEYNLGHTELLENVRGLAKLEGNLFFTGNVFAGVGIPDCIAHAEKIAEEIVAADGL